MALIPITNRLAIIGVAALTFAVVLLPFLWRNVFTIIVGALWGVWQIVRFGIVFFVKGRKEFNENKEWWKSPEANRISKEVHRFPKEVKVRADRAEGMAIYATSVIYGIYAFTALSATVLGSIIQGIIINLG